MGRGDLWLRWWWPRRDRYHRLGQVGLQLVEHRHPQPHRRIAHHGLAALCIRHIEIAWQSGPRWIRECRELISSFPALALGAASVRGPEGLEAAREAGLRYAVSSVFDPELCHAAGRDLVLVPGVMTFTEIWRARALGCRLVKLFPAAMLGPHYWRRLSAPLGAPLPFCIAAGGLGVADVLPWCAAGVDAVALGEGAGASSAMRQLLAALTPGMSRSKPDWRRGRLVPSRAQGPRAHQRRAQRSVRKVSIKNSANGGVCKDHGENDRPELFPGQKVNLRAFSRRRSLRLEVKAAAAPKRGMGAGTGATGD
jgi:2-dehydro-3-deoxyphosphogluconate aldolase/(4S)-4-hydroxy-2-oxoglutarate aldolase